MRPGDLKFVGTLKWEGVQAKILFAVIFMQFFVPFLCVFIQLDVPLLVIAQWFIYVRSSFPIFFLPLISRYFIVDY
jgi:hypothetical protein